MLSTHSMTQKTATDHALTVAVAGGKGGVGKTSVALALVQSIINSGHELTLLDCDVENPNCHLYLTTKRQTSQPVHQEVPEFDPDACIHCGQCADFCNFNALADIGTDLLVFNELCHSCGGCIRLCPQGALIPSKQIIGHVFTCESKNLAFFYGLLKVGSPRTTAVIESVESAAIKLRKPTPNNTAPDLTIVDAAPGTGCAAVAAITQADFVILVTEPTPYGLHDLTLSVEMLQSLDKPFGVVVNRMEPDRTAISDYCTENKIPLLLEIPFSRDVAVACAERKGILHALPQLEPAFLKMFNEAVRLVL